jgi:hypothetical protein
MLRPTYSARSIGYISAEEQGILAPLTRTTFPLILKVVGDCVRRHRLLLGILDTLRLRPNISLHFQPDAQGNASQLAWPSPWEVVLLDNSKINWWSGAYIYDAPRVIYRFSGREGDVVVGPRIHGGERLCEVVFDFSAWVPPQATLDGDVETHAPLDGYPTRATQLAARAASLLAPNRTITFQGLDCVQMGWLDASANANDHADADANEDGLITPKHLLLQQALALSPVPPPVVAETLDNALCLRLPPPPRATHGYSKRRGAVWILAGSLPAFMRSGDLTAAPGSKNRSGECSSPGNKSASRWTFMADLLRLVHSHHLDG